VEHRRRPPETARLVDAPRPAPPSDRPYAGGGGTVRRPARRARHGGGQWVVRRHRRGSVRTDDPALTGRDTTPSWVAHPRPSPVASLKARWLSRRPASP